MYQERPVNNMQSNRWGRPIMMVVSSVLLCISFILTIFTPLPLAIGNLQYGRKIGAVLMLGGLVLVSLIAIWVFKDLTLLAYYFSCVIMAIGFSEIIYRGFNPVKGLVVLGMGILSISAILGYFAVQSSGVKLRSFLIQQVSQSQDLYETQKKKLIETEGVNEDTMDVLAILDNPELMVDEALKVFPSYIFMGLFLMLWLNMFVILKSARILPTHSASASTGYSEKTLLTFKMPEHFIWPMIMAFSLYLFGDKIDPVMPVIGMTVVKCLGIFYFFQGLGIYIELLDRLRIIGFLRTILLVTTLMFAAQFLAAIGLFDMFIDFRKQIKKITRS